MLLIKNADVYAPEPLGKKDVLLSFDKIVQIGSNLTVNLPGTEIVDAAGKTLVPGFIDQHVHVTGGGGEGGFHSRVPELTLSDIAAAGVTTLVGVLGTDGITRSVESLAVKTKALNNEGITAYCLTGAYQYPPPTLTGSVARDIVYISEILGCKLAMSDHRGSHPTREEIIRLVSDIRMAALVAGKPGVLHIHVGSSPQGIEPIVDIVRTTDIPIKHFRPTHMTRQKKAAEFTHMGGYADLTAKKDLGKEVVSLLEEAVPALLTISSDANGSLPRWDTKRGNVIGMGVHKMTGLYAAVKEMIEDCGIPIETALSFITKNVAQALELYPQKGAVCIGSDADIVLLDKERNIDTVIAKGRKMMLGKEIIVHGMYEG